MMTSGHLSIGGIQLEFTWKRPAATGAPTLIFLHEGLGCVALWRDFPLQLANATGCGALIYSRAGYGASSPATLPRPTSYLHDEAEVLRAIIQQFDIRNSIVIGHSDGATIALIYAASRPLPGLSCLILEAPHVFVESITLNGIVAAAELYRTTDLRTRLTRYHGDKTDDVFWGWNDAWQRPEFHDWNIEGLLPAITAPTLLIQGQDDEYGTAAQLEAIERHSGGPVETLLLPACGHTPHQDQPARVLAEMTRFIQQHTSSMASQ